MIDLGNGADGDLPAWCARLVMAALLYGTPAQARTCNSEALRFAQAIPERFWRATEKTPNKKAWIAAHGDDVTLATPADSLALVRHVRFCPRDSSAHAA
jgi:hypothetical protein